MAATVTQISKTNKFTAGTGADEVVLFCTVDYETNTFTVKDKTGRDFKLEKTPKTKIPYVEQCFEAINSFVAAELP